MKTVSVIDLFAGPGGLSEGFCSIRRDNACPFRIALSVEKNPWAHKTLELRSFFRQFHGKAPDRYYDYLSGKVTREDLFKGEKEAAALAEREAWHAQLGGRDGARQKDVHRRVKAAIGQDTRWVLIGGPPCQAYSVIGRSRMLGADRKNGTDDYSKDHRHRLYRQYLRILATYAPAVFIMENVRGILSSRVKGNWTFKSILSDLQNPPRAVYGSPSASLEYRIYSLSTGSLLPSDLEEYVIESESHGVPQKRHRVILLGIRSDLSAQPGKLRRSRPPSVGEAIGLMPPLRSGLSEGQDTDAAWLCAVRSVATTPWLSSVEDDVREEIERAISLVEVPEARRGGRIVEDIKHMKSSFNESWFADNNLPGHCNHETRSHIESDLHRYFFAACFARAKGMSPKLGDFPKALYPDHKNLRNTKLEDIIFDDRFRVQVEGNPATTVVSHIAKDGHYFIHFDAAQCRSLTVREAARLQTFPDNYFFEGTRTQQYTQVGNAVPPYLARQIAEIVADVLL